MSFDGLRVVSFESRRAPEMAELIRRKGGVEFVAPAMREVPITDNRAAFDFAARLYAAAFDMMILLTGVGTRLLRETLADGRFAEALRHLTTVARGSKPAAVLREMGVPVSILVPEPNTWREVLAAIEGRPERRIAMQEYGVSSVALRDALEARGAEVTTVPVYRWDLPEDTAPLREAVRRIARGRADVVLFTASVQVSHLVKIAREDGLEAEVFRALPSCVVASIGPSTSAALAEFGIKPDFEPSHPKMGFLIQELAGEARAILRRKGA